MSEDTRSGLLDRTLANLRRAWRDVARSARTGDIAGSLHEDLPEDDAALVRTQIETCLKGRGGEVSARARAADLGRAYLGLGPKGRAEFLRILAREQGVDRAAVEAAMDELRAAGDEVAVHRAERKLRDALVPPRVKLFTQFNGLPEGVKFLVELRADLLRLKDKDPAMVAMDADLKELLASWFDVGFLNLDRIYWKSPAALLEKLMAYEAVHEIRSWSDLKNRLDSDRRCFAFFHPRMPDEPLIFVEVALVDGMADSIHALLDPAAPAQDPRTADTAIFYSISNCQRGLAGVSFGSFLIKRVVDDLAGHFHNLKHFATLSPIPGFRAWLDEVLVADGDKVLGPASAEALRGLAAAGSGAQALRDVLARPDWPDQPEVAGVLREPLLRLCARYLLHERRDDGSARDRVAHFHLSNGARVERINWMANRSPAGLAQSAGLMVNYRYKLDEIESNHEAYRGEGKVIAAPAVRRLARRREASR